LIPKTAGGVAASGSEAHASNGGAVASLRGVTAEINAVNCIFEYAQMAITTLHLHLSIPLQNPHFHRH
jgi:hypothetical protein